MKNNFLKEFRCPCGKLLFKGNLLGSVVEIKCKKCGRVQLFPHNAQASYAGFNSSQDNKTGNSPLREES